ncbi:hypothetical protein RA307_15520 [Xanthobacteraceae bacterium Astr-EGSB]|uniref:hypothetical protein n=1 Tax=Astrobacterium formosum TaxID=3069710 RepID=UPI0027B081C3|nr:hypothetical protein [Xanthobacteraceae bacterium Astr-EGSB]
MIDRRAIAAEIQEALAARGIAVMFNDRSAAFIVRLSGCTVGCASRYSPSDVPGPSIAGRTFDDVAADEADLAARAVTAVDAFFGSLPTSRASARLNQPNTSVSPADGDRNGCEQNQ